MGFSSVEDVHAIEQETPWSERELPATVYDMLDKIATYKEKTESMKAKVKIANCKPTLA